MWHPNGASVLQPVLRSSLIEATQFVPDLLHMVHVQLSGARDVQDAPRVVPRLIVEMAPEALVNMLTKASGASISLLTQLCKQQGFDGLVGKRSRLHAFRV